MRSVCLPVAALALWGWGLGTFRAAAQDFPEIRFLPVLSGFNAPVHLTHAGDGSRRLFIVEQPGRILILHNNAMAPAPFLDIRDRVSCCGERGLLSVAFPPGYTAKLYFFVNYTDRAGNTVVARYNVSADPNVADRNSERVLLNVQQPFSNHNGGLMKFGPNDGYLYIALGDGGSANDPLGAGQNLRTLLGKLLRIDPSAPGSPTAYSVPASNPFAGQVVALPEIWAWGLRNPWKFSFDRATGDLYIADVGQNNFEEVNFQPAASKGGENYGWKTMEGSQCFPGPCSTAGLTLPVAEYNHANGDCSITGGYVYRGRRFPSLQGIYFYGDYCTGRLRGLRRSGSSWVSRAFLATPFRITTFGEDEDGEIYLANYANGSLHLLSTGSPQFAAAGVVNAATFQPGLVPGSLATLFGSDLSGAFGIASAQVFPLPAELSGASVLVDGARVPLLAASGISDREQLNFQVPWEAAGKAEVTIVVENNGRRSDAIRVTLVPASPAVFSYSSSGPVGAPQMLAAALHSLTGASATESNPAVAGAYVSLFATGLGAVDQPVQSGMPAGSSPLARTLELPVVTVDGMPAEVLFSGLAPGFAGLYQINIRLPATRGGLVEVKVRISGRESPAVMLPVRAL